jgi:hypothetical protein
MYYFFWIRRICARDVARLDGRHVAAAGIARLRMRHAVFFPVGMSVFLGSDGAGRSEREERKRAWRWRIDLGDLCGSLSSTA